MVAGWLFLRDNARWLGAGALLMWLSCFGQTFFFAIFSAEIRAAHGLSHGEWGAIYAAGTAAAAAVMIWTGGLADRFGPRPLALVALAGMALGCAALALVPTVWALPAIVFAIRIAGQGMVPHVAVVAISRWFVATRGRALAVATLGFQLGEATLPLIFVAAKRVVDWHVLWMVAAGIILVALWPVARLLALDRAPRAGEIAATSVPGIGGQHWTRAEVLRQPMFWALMPGLAGFPALVSAFWFHQVAFAEEKGWSHLAFVSMLPIGTAAFVAGTALFGWAMDRFGARRLLPVYLLPMVAGMALAGGTASVPGLATAFILMGVTGGGQATVASAAWAELYGTRNVGAIRGAVIAIFVLASALGPFAAGAAMDAGLALSTQLAGYALWFAAASAVIALALQRLPRG